MNLFIRKITDFIIGKKRLDKPEDISKAKEPTEFQKLQLMFNPQTDIIVIGENKSNTLSIEEQSWLFHQKERVIYFPDNLLVNTSIVRCR